MSSFLSRDPLGPFKIQQVSREPNVQPVTHGVMLGTALRVQQQLKSTADENKLQKVLQKSISGKNYTDRIFVLRGSTVVNCPTSHTG